MDVISIDLKYGSEVIATYEFDELADANNFLIRAKALADSLQGAKTVCRVTIMTSLPEQSSDQVMASLLQARKG